ncbi:MAG TPA: glycosyltransferase family 39 protein, partial [Terriglobales bacterium]|nr:glycosyltransferase family 39 protein [Terriglobales bacterium]
MSQRVREWILLAGFCAFLYFYGLGQFGLVGADEPRYAQVAREMLERHDWITPTLGGVAWLEKPPLYYWQAMTAFRVFGVHDWVARWPSALDASLLVVGVYLFLRKLRPGFHLDGALMSASVGGIVGFAHSASTDMPLAATFALAMLSWYAWWETRSRSLLAAFYFFSALGVLAKGPVAVVLAGAVIVLFAVAAGDLRVFWKTLWLPGVLVFLAVSCPWYLAVEHARPEFFRVFILEHNLARFSTDLYHHRQPFWFYLPVAVLAFVPWIVFVLEATSEVGLAGLKERRAMFEGEDALSVFLLLWLAVPIVFFSLSQSKLPGYILPAIPAGPLLVAEYVRRHVEAEDRPALWILVLHALVAAAILVPGVLIAYVLLQHRLPWGMPTLVTSTVALGVAIGVVVTLTGKLGLRGLYFVTLVPVVLNVAALIRIGAPVLDQTLSARPVAQQLASMETKMLPVAGFGIRRETEYGLAFYRNQVIPRYEQQQVPDGEHLLVVPEGARPAIPH